MSITLETQSHFLRLFEIALSDGEYSKLELNLLYKIAEEKNISKNEIDSILISPIGNMEIPGSIEKKIEYLYDFARMVLADNAEHADEIYMLEKFCRTFDFKGDNVKELSAYLIESAKQGKSKEQLLNELN